MMPESCEDSIHSSWWVMTDQQLSWLACSVLSNTHLEDNLEQPFNVRLLPISSLYLCENKFSDRVNRLGNSYNLLPGTGSTSLNAGSCVQNNTFLDKLSKDDTCFPRPAFLPS